MINVTSAQHPRRITLHARDMNVIAPPPTPPHPKNLKKARPLRGAHNKNNNGKPWSKLLAYNSVIVIRVLYGLESLAILNPNQARSPSRAKCRSVPAPCKVPLAGWFPQQKLQHCCCKGGDTQNFSGSPTSVGKKGSALTLRPDKRRLRL